VLLKVYPAEGHEFWEYVCVQSAEGAAGAGEEGGVCQLRVSRMLWALRRRSSEFMIYNTIPCYLITKDLRLALRLALVLVKHVSVQVDNSARENNKQVRKKRNVPQEGAFCVQDEPSLIQREHLRQTSDREEHQGHVGPEPL